MAPRQGVNPHTPASVAAAMVFAALFATSSLGQEPPTPAGSPSREEFERLTAEFDRFKRDYSRLEEENRDLNERLGSGEDTNAVMRASADNAALEIEIEDYLAGQRRGASPGTNAVLLSGFAFANFSNIEGMDSTFGAAVVPIILWKPNAWILFEAEIEFALDEEETEVALGYAQVSFILNDYLTLGVGKFLLPFGTFWERWHPAWINKLPTMPLLYAHGVGFIGEAGVGAQLRGGARVGSTKFNYSLYVINGPSLAEDPPMPGGLEWERNLDNNNNKSVGGRVGFLPVPALEIGLSALWGRVNDSGSELGRIETLILGLDLWWAHVSPAIAGRIEVRAEVAWADTDDATFQDGDTGGTFTYRNKRNGWFVQVAYRPTYATSRILRDLEIVLRYDKVQLPGPAEIGTDRDRLTLGMDYWILPNAVAKLAYFVDSERGGNDRNGVVLQTAIGF